MSIRRFATVMSALLLAAVGAVATPATARADGPCDPDQTPPEIHSFGPDSVTLGLHSQLIHFFVDVSDQCTQFVYWAAVGPYVSVGPGDTTQLIKAASNADAGASYVDVVAYDGTASEAKMRFPFSLLRATRFSGFNVSPEPVKKGKYVTVKGTLKRADWNKHKYVRYGAKSQLVQIQFKAKGGVMYETITTVKLRKGSAVKTKIKVAGAVAKSGHYRLSYLGNGKSGASESAADYVKVK